MNTHAQQTAASLQRAGFPLTLLSGKKPILNDWPNNPIEPGAIESHTGNFGVICGKGFFVFDVDDMDAFIMYLMENGLDCPSDTYCVSSAKGLHYYYQMPQGMETMRNAVRIAGFADIRATNGQVAAEGSIHETGHVYECVTRKPIAPCPTWLIELLNKHNVSEAHAGKRGEVLIESDDAYAIDRATQHLKRCEAAIENQGGDQATFAAAARCKDFGLSKDTTYMLMAEYFNPRCEPEWNPDELREKVENAFSYGASPQGVASPVAAFINAGLVPQQTAPTVDQVSNPSTSPVTGENPKHIGVGTGYDKSNHTVNATRFLTECYPSGTLKCYDMEFYWFDGKSWVHASDAVIKSALGRAMLNAEPSSGTVKGTFEMLQHFTHCDEWNTYQGKSRDGLILMNNGILDINTGELLPHTMGYLCSNIIPFDYSPTATAPTWETFLNSTFENDQQRVQFIEEWIGYNLTRDYRYQKIAMLIGQQRSGKSTIMSILESIQGVANYGSVDINGLGKDSKLHMLSNKLSIVVPDAANPSRNEAGAVVGNMKSISGGDSLTFDRKFKTAVTTKFAGKISIVTNNVLNLQDDSGALAGRLIICPFNKSFYGNEDTTLKARLIAEIPGIINRCIVALRRLNARGRFVEPEAAQQWRDDVQDRANPLFPFIREKVTIDVKERVPASQLYSAYRSWCVSNGSRPLTGQAFKRALLGAVPSATHSRGMRIDGKVTTGYVGVTCADPLTELFSNAQAVNS
ncbi:TPA: bifunctional DNA primase/polymerase [Vibrio parahaemolyticus]|uniref:phage/plasmid primase, P4 family n=1 Tax=Vibrio parahaemolyticus TaxID=670 RepID=UPI0009353658|nr:phage/plasmid primase, P4 family [Vibrio parahaemolyticus]EGQ8195817.1 hypothetical protein [Vibrio parahaemolyticus]TPA13945.1 hypothetical protein DXJ89_24890 [Vibrio parahaemolyticus]TPA40113.1 hypothetical protein DXJ91_24935 [Vibrio parahaemolyticus]TPA53874.1 hypothetical protein DXJ90_24795 [Vibrio parahaemolyticus]HCE2536541.1 bifunctional DNA primase/polymerase [Vibrio parahaemolyticus]